MIFCLDSEFKPRTLKEISLNSCQSDLTLVSLLVAIPAQSRYLSELSRSVIPLRD
jgi:hypothetical protein